MVGEGISVTALFGVEEVEAVEGMLSEGQ